MAQTLAQLDARLQEVLSAVGTSQTEQSAAFQRLQALIQQLRDQLSQGLDYQSQVDVLNQMDAIIQAMTQASQAQS